MRKLTPFLAILLSFYCQGQPGTIQMTPKNDLGLVPQKLSVPEKFWNEIDTTFTVFLPPGYTAKVFYTGGLFKPRFMSWGPDSVLHIADLSGGKVFALPDTDHDGVADTAITAADNVFGHDVKFYEGAMYVAEERQVLRLTDDNQDGYYENRTTFIANIGEGAPQPTGGHRTRTIVFDPDKKKVYLSIGSFCNVCRETFRGIIEEYNDDGTGKRTYANGVRNAVGMTLRESTGKLWATSHGSDRQGNDIPPEWIDIVRDGGFYGYPFAHSNQVYFDFNAHAEYQALLPITAQDSVMVNKMVQPGGLVQAHSALMAVTFANSSFRIPYKNGAFVAYRGSWNRSPATGYKVVYLDFTNPGDTTANYVADFLTGFLTDSILPPQRWARPTGLLTDNRGNLYMSSDDINRFIVIVSPDPNTTGIDNPKKSLASLGANYPNPFHGETTIPFQLDKGTKVQLEVFDHLGRTQSILVNEMLSAGQYKFKWTGNTKAAGLYYYRLRTSEGVLQRKMLLMH